MLSHFTLLTVGVPVNLTRQGKKSTNTAGHTVINYFYTLRMLNKFISGKQMKKNKQNKRKREERKKGKGNTCVFFLTSSLASADLTEKKPKINENNLTLLKLSLG